MMDIKQIRAERLKALMDGAGESVADLQRAVIQEGNWITQPTIRSVLAAERNARPRILEAIARHYGVLSKDFSGPEGSVSRAEALHQRSVEN